MSEFEENTLIPDPENTPLLINDGYLYSSIINAIASLVGRSSIRSDESLKNEVNLDSLMLVIVITDVCTLHGIDIFNIDERKVPGLITVSDLYHLINGAKK